MLSRETSHTKVEEWKQKLESSIANGVATVVTLKIGTSMHIAKARVHRRIRGHR